MLQAFLLALAIAPQSGDAAPVPLFPATIAQGDAFGLRLQADGERMIASSILAGPNGLSTGTAYVFHETATGWVEEALLLPTPAQLYQNFGYSLDLEGDRAAVGAPGEDGTRQDQGAVYVFERQAGIWVQTTRIISTAPEEAARFGMNLSLSGDRLAISAPGASQAAGANNHGHVDVHVLVGGVWRSEQMIESFAPNVSWDGFQLDLDHDRLVVTLSSYAPQTGYLNSVRVHERGPTGWSQSAAIAPPLAEPGVRASFGDSLGLLGDVLLIGAPRRAIDGNIRSGSVFGYAFDGSSWQLRDTIEPPVRAAEQYFGWDVELDGERALISTYPAEGLNEGSFHLYREQGLRWGLERSFHAPSSVTGPTFAQEVSLSADRLFAGVTSDTPAGPWSGSVLAYDIPLAYSSFCTPTATSQGEPAHLFLTGPAQVDATGLELLARPVPNQAGLVFFGDTAVSLPFGNGLRCVGGTIQRLMLTEGESHELRVPFAPLAEGIPAGQTRYLQAWFRDPAAGGAGYNLSDAIEINFRP